MGTGLQNGVFFFAMAELADELKRLHLFIFIIIIFYLAKRLGQIGFFLFTDLLFR